MDCNDHWDDEIDTSGLLCPLPVLKARHRLRPMPPGAVLRVVCTDPAAAIDMPHFCAENGHALVGTAEVDGATAYLIRKGAGPAADQSPKPE